MTARVHGLVPPTGSVEVTRSPSISTATHNDELGHDMAARGTPKGIAEVVSRASKVHAVGPPVGLLEIAAPPKFSTARHEDDVGQETPVKSIPVMGIKSGVTFHCAAPPRASRVVTTSTSSTATQSVP